MDNKNLKKILEDLLVLPKEPEWAEFKEANQSFDFEKIGKYFSALSNEANIKNQPYGWLIFGVNNSRRVIGTQYKPTRTDLDDLKSGIAQHTTNNITFVEIFELNLPEGRVVMFQIPPAPKGIPVAWKGHYYGRNDEELSALNIQEIEQIRNQTKQYDWSAQICENASLDNLDQAAIQKARSEFVNKFPHLTGEVNSWNDRTFLNKAKVTINDKITFTAILLLGKPESDYFISPAVAKISWILKDENNVEKDYEHFSPPLLLNVDRLLRKIRNLTYRYLPDGTLFPIEITQYDPWVIREALHNCIAHQDYELRGRIVIIENPDDLIFTNVGSFIP